MENHTHRTLRIEIPVVVHHGVDFPAPKDIAAGIADNLGDAWWTDDEGDDYALGDEWSYSYVDPS